LIKLRAVFEKTGRAKYISHLDLNRCMLRIFRRSGLPIWYTEGFNPHPYFSFALALSLGFESDCEILDFNLNEDISYETIKERLNAVMPAGMKISRVYTPKMKITAIAKAEYRVELLSDSPEILLKDVKKLHAAEEILIDKKTKKGIKTVDLKPSIEMKSISQDDKKIVVNMCLPAGTQTNFNPNLFIEALRNTAEIPFETGNISRTGIYCENNEIFS